MKKIISALLCVVLGLSAGSCKKDPMSAAEVIQFSVPGVENNPADNATALSLTVIIPKSSDPQTQVVLTTDIGTFVNSNSNTITASVNSAGQATAAIKSAVIGSATIKAAIAGQTSYSVLKSVNFTAPDPNSIFTVAPFVDNIMADGSSETVLTAVVTKTLPSGAQSVVFTADNGALFSNGTSTTTATADASGNATAYLHSSTIGPVHVTMFDDNVTRNQTVNFARSVPDYMLLNALPSLAVGFGNSLSIAVSLTKATGKPSPGYLFTCTAVDSSNNLIGLFSSQPASDANGSATLTFTTGTSTYKGIVKITIALQQYPNINSSINVLVN